MKSSKRRGAAPRKLAVATPTAVASNPAIPDALGGSLRNYQHLFAALALSILTLLAYGNSFDGGFVLDNRGLLLNDPRLRQATAANLSLIWRHTYWWPTGEGGVYRPFTTLSYLFNYALLGNADHPVGYHWVNFFLHALNVLLVYALVHRFIRKFWPAFFIAAIWAVHPVLTEAVTNIVGRADLLAATGLLGGFLLYLKSVETDGWQRWAWLSGLIVVTAIGVFSKENAVVLPAAIILYELMFRQEHQRSRVAAGLIAVLAPMALMFYQRAQVLAASLPKEVPLTDNPILRAGFWEGRLTAIDVAVRYLSLIVWPARLSADYSWNQIPIARGSLGDWFCVAILLALIPALVSLYRWDRRAFFLTAFALLWMAPVANLIFPIGSIMAERFLYVPALAVIVCVVLGIYVVAERAHVPAYQPVVLCVLILATLGARTWVRNADWKDDRSMARALLRAAPNSFKPHDFMANVLFASDPTHANIEQVIAESEKSLAILDPLPDAESIPDPYELAGTCYVYHGDYGKAITALKRFLAIEQASFAAFERKAAAGQGGYEGTESLKSAQRITGERQGDAYTWLSMAYLRSGDAAAAVDAAAHARALNPVSPPMYRQLARIALSAGRVDEAAALYIEGAFVTSDGSLRKDLLDLYQRMGPGNCALKPGPRGPAINPACPMVHSHLCAAAAGTIGTLERTDQMPMAQARKKMFVEEFGCFVQ
jgi:tetratricopeptide (TPR) repeat protein